MPQTRRCIIFRQKGSLHSQIHNIILAQQLFRGIKKRVKDLKFHCSDFRDLYAVFDGGCGVEEIAKMHPPEKVLDVETVLPSK